ncbi:translation elongation factor Ts (EF-Ts) [Desulfonispora thiosulfatigenes DSM 11270]|uniref:Elongation factor Ts n=1 Tax=Desulfonispora thiosulfatigenes DSM 11270 TaxID=656914 RepID=A0A1W1VKS6_DESTI|nr:translation elongation factor Ts [Desulfonispora thiosulfatigenes]SMB93985.1 translation elongation factor Ts (EF-Ts) [Desulfonispora thiosulfatigenes DSM 11270]
MTISAAMVKELREKSGAGMMDCKKALIETNGDIEKAGEYLREKGLAAAAKKSGRIAAEGAVTSYIHMGGKIGVLLEVNCETDFVAKTEKFQDFTKNIAMQIAATKPEYIAKEEVPEEVITKEKEILKAQAINEGKNEKFVEKIVEGRVEKIYKDLCLLEQPYIKDTDKTIAQFLSTTVAEIGENIVLRRFVRFELGEGIEKKQEDFASEVMAEINKN